jgi:hypothetical protein
MEKLTVFLRFVAALFIAMSAGLRLAQNIRESVKAAKDEIDAEDKLMDSQEKLQKLLDDAVTAATKDAR